MPKIWECIYNDDGTWQFLRNIPGTRRWHRVEVVDIWHYTGERYGDRYSLCVDEVDIATVAQESLDSAGESCSILEWALPEKYDAPWGSERYYYLQGLRGVRTSSWVANPSYAPDGPTWREKQKTIRQWSEDYHLFPDRVLAECLFSYGASAQLENTGGMNYSKLIRDGKRLSRQLDEDTAEHYRRMHCVPVNRMGQTAAEYASPGVPVLPHEVWEHRARVSALGLLPHLAVEQHFAGQDFEVLSTKVTDNGVACLVAISKKLRRRRLPAHGGIIKNGRWIGSVCGDNEPYTNGPRAGVCIRCETVHPDKGPLEKQRWEHRLELFFDKTGEAINAGIAFITLEGRWGGRDPLSAAIAFDPKLDELLAAHAALRHQETPT